jgi:TRAP-type C4-dicarboxylate transport system substrate-binding protein
LKEQREIIEKVAKLSAQDQKNLLEKYEKKFERSEVNSCS